MKPSIFISLILFGMMAMGLSHCATGDYSGGEGAAYAEPDPLMQQATMQEEMSKVTRSLIQ